MDFVPYIALYAIIFSFGSIIGSFSGVVIYRLPLGISIVCGASHCNFCKRRLAFYELIPVVGWIIAGGKCKTCGEPIPVRYPLIETFLGAFACVCYYSVDSLPYALICFATACILTVISFIDADTMTIPDSLNITLALTGGIAIFSGIQPSVFSAFAGIFTVSIPMFILTMFIEGAFGGGDIKLMAAGGFLLGVKGVILSFFTAVILAGIYAVYLLVRGLNKEKGSYFPFGPFLSIGIITALIWGNKVIEWYFSL